MNRIIEYFNPAIKKGRFFYLNQLEISKMIFSLKEKEVSIFIPPSAISLSNENIIEWIDNEFIYGTSRLKSSKVENPIYFSLDSQLQRIEKNAFYASGIRSISIPASVCELEEKWCFDTPLLTKVTISAENKYFKNCEENDKLIVGKSDINKDEYDVLVFACRDIETVAIPQYIKQISSSAFEKSKIKAVFIPSQVKRIGESSFHYCKELTKVEFESSSNLEIIENDAFSFSLIEEITIPSRVTEIRSSVFYSCESLRKVEFQSNSELRIIGGSSFRRTRLERFFVPSNVVRICSYAFSDDKDLKHVEFAPNSKLQTIEENVFNNVGIECLSIPSSVCELKENWNAGIANLNQIEIMNDNYKNCEENDQLIVGKSDFKKDEYDVLIFACRNIETVTIPSYIKYISSYAFENSKIKTISFPSQVKRIGEYSFHKCQNLAKVDFQSDSNLEIVESCAFHESKFQNIYIPQHVKKIESYALPETIANIEFSPYSEIQTIESFSFNSDNLKALILPKHVKKINIFSFIYCHNLQFIDISPDSELEEIESDAFYYTYLKCFYIPPSVTSVECGAFIKCYNLMLFELDENVNMSAIDEDAFGYKRDNLEFMIPVKMLFSFIAKISFGEENCQ